jgi:uncharacterized protein (TIRG00374 family)
MKSLLGIPKVHVFIGLLIGIGLLFLMSRFVNLSATMRVLQQNLATPRGLILALLSGIAFLSAFSIRGIRWKLFLNPIGNVSIVTAIRLFLVSIFINFLLPISSGEIAKTLMLKRNAAIPISRSLPTIAMDRSMDLLPVFFIIIIVPLLGIHMDFKLWLVLGTVAGLFLAMIFFVGLAAWKRDAAITLLSKITGMLPKTYGSKITAFATSFVDTLLSALRRPKIFILAVLLTCVAVTFDSLFAMFAFWTIGFPISFGTAIFGYTVFNMFFILPTPPGQLGSNEAVGLLVFTGLLRLPPNFVTAMIIFSHPWAALLMCTAGITSLKALGLTIRTALRKEAEESEEALLPEKEETPILLVEPVK